MTDAFTEPPAEPPLPGDSREQRAAEAVVVKLVGDQLGIVLSKQRRKSPAGALVEVDGLSEDPPVIVEAWAHQGPPRPAQKYKVMTDALKLVWAERVFFPAGARKILALADDAAAAHFRGAELDGCRTSRGQPEIGVDQRRGPC